MDETVDDHLHDYGRTCAGGRHGWDGHLRGGGAVGERCRATPRGGAARGTAGCLSHCWWAAWPGAALRRGLHAGRVGCRHGSARAARGAHLGGTHLCARSERCSRAGAAPGPFAVPARTRLGDSSVPPLYLFVLGGIGASAPCLAAVPVVCDTTRLQLGFHYDAGGCCFSIPV